MGIDGLPADAGGLGDVLDARVGLFGQDGDCGVEDRGEVLFGVSPSAARDLGGA